jgi:hypothetical protein
MAARFLPFEIDPSSSVVPTDFQVPSIENDRRDRRTQRIDWLLGWAMIACVNHEGGI